MTGETTVPAWKGFLGGTWQRDIDVADFIRRNYTPYDGDGSFLVGPTDRTTRSGTR
jgi:formate C-acetyltransferase